MDEFAWEQVKQQFPRGAVVTGEVTQVVPYGVWVNVGVGCLCLLRIPDAGLERGQQTADCFHVGQALTAKVLWHNEHEQQLLLTRRA